MAPRLTLQSHIDQLEAENIRLIAENGRLREKMSDLIRGWLAQNAEWRIEAEGALAALKQEGE